MMSGRKSLAELVAELDDPVPKDIDPEALEEANRESEDEEKLDESAAREHYETVGKSKLRKQPQTALGPQYSGSRVSRADLEELEEKDDDPFQPKGNSYASDRGSSEDEDYDDPEAVSLDVQDDDDEEIDSDEAFEKGEEDMFRKKGFTFKDSGKSAAALRKATSASQESGSEVNDKEVVSQGESDESSLDAEFDELQVTGDGGSRVDSASADDMSTDGSASSEEDADDAPSKDVLRAMMSTEQKSVVSELSGAIQAEVAKGMAIKKQYTTFDTLVGTRVHLQKTLIAANSLPLAEASDPAALAKAAASAETAALSVLNTLTSLLHAVHGVNQQEDKSGTVLGKRPFSATTSTSSKDIQQAIETSQKASKLGRRTILTKWANKTQATALSTRNRLVQKPAEDSLITTLDGQLIGSNCDRLIQKTRIARSCAPLQQATESTSMKTSAQDTVDERTMEEDPLRTSNAVPVYDDADFYALVLRELIDHKKSYTKSASNGISSSALAAATTPTNLLRGNKVKRVNVDTKASKGRKMKYSVHEKLQNFMAPTNLGSWERRQAEELFAGLLGRQIAKLDETEEVDIMDETGNDIDTKGLRLFGRA